MKSYSETMLQARVSHADDLYVEPRHAYAIDPL